MVDRSNVEGYNVESRMSNVILPFYHSTNSFHVSFTIFTCFTVKLVLTALLHISKWQMANTTITSRQPFRVP